tara:strand:+ start:1817 stop:2122 length:306 start_codon:yes stop_codon:yes gene_type:complete
MKINNEKIEGVHINSIEAEPLIKRFQQEEIENETLLQSFDEDLCELMQKYIDVNHKYRAKELFFDDKDIVEDFNYSVTRLQTLIKETYKKGVIKEDTLLGF